MVRREVANDTGGCRGRPTAAHWHFMNGVPRTTLRWLWTLLALAVIAYAALVALGREFLPRLDDLQPRIDDTLSRYLGTDAKIHGIDGDWTGFSPRLRVSTADFTAPRQSRPFLAIEALDAELDLIRSLLDGRPAWNDLHIQRLRIRLSESATGWGLSTSPEEASGAVEHLARTLLAGRRTRIARFELELHFRSGETAVLGARNLLLENSGSFHRAGGTITLGGSELAALAAEWRADDPVRNWRESRGRAHLTFSRLDLSGSLGILLRGFAPAWSRQLAPVDTPIAAELWLEAQGDGRAQLSGQLSAAQLALAGELETEPLRNLSAAVTGWVAPGKDWGLRFQDLHFAWRDVEIAPLTLGFRQPLGAASGPRFSLAADHLELATLNALLLATGILPEPAATALDALSPSGKLLAPRIDVDLETPQKIIGVRTTITGGAIASWRDSPALRGVSGALVIDGLSGSLTLDGGEDTEILFPTAYDDYLQVGKIRGRVTAAVTEDFGRLQVAAAPLEVTATGEGGTVAAAFTLHQPLTRGGGGELWLSAGIRDTHPDYARQFLPRVLEPRLKDWLERALGPMSIPEGAFIWRGPLVKDAGPRRTIQVYVQATDATITFDPAWPALREVDAQVAVDDTQVSGMAAQATIAGVPLTKIRFHTRDHTTDTPQLAVTGHALTPVDQALAVLADSPLRDRLTALRDWRTSGATRIDLDLTIPLSGDARDAAYTVAAELVDAGLAHRTRGIAFEQINGALQFTSAAGVQAENLRFRLWGQPFAATVRGTPQGDIEIRSAGAVAVGALPAWPAWLRPHLTGTTHYQADLRIPITGPPELTLSSELIGLAATLPAPFTKAPEHPMPLRIGLAFDEEATRLDAWLDDRFQARAIFAGAEAQSVAIGVGGSSPQLPDRGLDLRGHLDFLDIDAWRKLLPADNDVNAELQHWQPHIALELDALRGAGMDFAELHLEAVLAGPDWRLAVASDALSGTLRVPATGNRPLQLELDHLVLPQPSAEAPDSRLAALDPAALPALDFQVRQLSLGERKLGELAFALRRLPDGVRAENIRGEITGLRTGVGEHQATLEWRRPDTGHQSRFEGTILAGDLAAVLGAWDLPGAIKSKRAEMVAAWTWPGRPWEFRARHLRGETAMHIHDGTFQRTTAGASNALMKLIGLVNFDTWLRRLQLDFSDLFAEGMAFDELDTRMTFDNGILHFSKPVKVELPSGKMRLEGRADLIAETIDAHLVATLPVGTNLPWIAALAGGLPAAAGVYLTSRVFGRQVDKISSLAYRVTGPWEDPHIEVERIFSDQTK